MYLKSSGNLTALLTINTPRLVVQGYTQKSGVDNEETFSLVDHKSLLRTLLLYSVNRGHANTLNKLWLLPF